jgi:hypothetical protein
MPAGTAAGVAFLQRINEPGELALEFAFVRRHQSGRVRADHKEKRRSRRCQPASASASRVRVVRVRPNGACASARLARCRSFRASFRFHPPRRRSAILPASRSVSRSRSSEGLARDRRHVAMPQAGMQVCVNIAGSPRTLAPAHAWDRRWGLTTLKLPPTGSRAAAIFPLRLRRQSNHRLRDGTT